MQTPEPAVKKKAPEPAEVKKFELPEIKKAPAEQVVVKLKPKKPAENYKKPWFIPILRSKFLTIELLKILFQHRYQVVLFLRSVCKGSEWFLDQFFENEIKH